MMKKITFFFFLLAVSLGYSQTVIEDFEGTAPAFKKADGLGSIEVADNPDKTTSNTSAKALRIITSTTSQGWQGGEMIFQGDKLDLTTANKSVQIQVYSTTATDILAKVVTGGGPASATDTRHTGSGWESLTFNFANGKDGTVAADGIYTNLVFYPAWNNVDGTCTAGCYAGSTENSSPDITLYLDNITGIAGTPPPDTTIPTEASATPFNYGAHLALLDGLTDTGTFTNYWNPSYNFGEAPQFIDLDTTDFVNKAARINLKIGWGGGVNANGANVKTDLTAYDTVHIDYFIPSSVDPGVNGHQFYLDLISQTNGANSEAFYGFGTTVGGANSGTIDEVIVFDAWQSIDIPLATFAGKGFDVANFLQFKIGAQSDIRTALGYFDNLYFYKSSTLRIDNSEVLGFSMYPNPAANSLNISAKEVIQNAAIYNVLGRQVMNLNINKNNESIDVSSLASGMYLIKYTTENSVGTAKFIKE
jgi:hypothetical protein